MHSAPALVHVPTAPPEGSGGDRANLAASWRAQGAPHDVRAHPQTVSRYAIGSEAPMIGHVRYSGVGYE